MTKTAARSYISSYLKQNFIPYDDKSVDDCFVMQFVAKYSPDSKLECSIYFRESRIDALVYYSKGASLNISQQQDLSKLFRLINYINANLCPCPYDGMGGELYEPSYLFNPVLYLTEDGQNDLTFYVNIDYDLFDIAPLEACDFITAAMPELLDELTGCQPNLIVHLHALLNCSFNSSTDSLSCQLVDFHNHLIRL
jgi:hypothetical protein